MTDANKMLFGDAIAVGLFTGAHIARKRGATQVADLIESEGRKHASWLQPHKPDPAGEAEYCSWAVMLEMVSWEMTMQESESHDLVGGAHV